MRLPWGLLLALLLLGVALAGCVTQDPGDDGEGDATGEPLPPDPSDDPDDPATPGPGPDPDRPRSKVAPPAEQQVDDPSQLERPGQYALLPRASNAKDRTWTVPTWNTGATWTWETTSPFAAGHKTRETHTVTGTTTAWDLEVYQVHKVERDRDGEVTSDKQAHHTHASLVALEDDGYIEHVIHFPLADGKRWVFAIPAAGGGITKVTAEARHQAGHLHQGSMIEAWSVVLKYEGDGDVEVRQWFGVAQENLVKREIWADYQGVHSRFLTTTLVQHDTG